MPVSSIMISGKTKICGIIGDPVAHTVSPAMHNAAFRTMGLDYLYLPFGVKKEKLPAAIEGMKALDIRGLNITIPHKIAVIPFLDGIDPLAEIIGSVNTIVNENGFLKGYNTDAAGFLQALRARGIEPAGKVAVILGAGGASRAISFTLAESGAELVILNRATGLERARQLAEKISRSCGGRAKAQVLEENILRAELRDADILVNATSVGMSPHTSETPVPARLLKKKLVVFDIVYNPLQTRLLAEAEAAGALTIGGLDMLVGQGAMAFQLWTGQEAPLEVMTKAAADALKSDVGGDHIEVGSAEGQSPFPEGLGFTLKVYPEGVFPQPDKSPKSGGFRGLISVPKHTLKTNIALIGFMGAGKTEVGKILAQRLGRRFVEIDALIENRANKSIAGIFQQDGELAFRELELDITKDVAAGENQVIAGGGGIVLNKINVDRLQKGAVIVYLAASPAAIIRRTGQAQGVRPLLNVSDKAGKISELLRFRKPLYESAADITVYTSRISVDTVVDRIIAELKRYESPG